MPGWNAFLGLTLAVLLVLLALARLSQGVTNEVPQSSIGSDGDTASIRKTESEVEIGSTDHADRQQAHSGYAAGRSDGEVRPTSGPGQAPELPPGVLLANVALTQGLFGAVLAGGAWSLQIPTSALGVGGARTGLAAAGLGAAFGSALWGASELASGAADAAGVTYDESLRGTLAPVSAAGWAVLLGAILPTIAAVEELLFRAALIGVPAAGYGISPWPLAVASSVAFALGHGAQGRVGVAVTGALGFALAAGYVLSGSLLVVVVAHYVVNALEFLVHER